MSKGTVQEKQLQQLSSGLVDLGLDLGPEVQDKLIAFLTLLGKWNKVYNLTAITDPMQMVALHLLDSLAMGPFLQATHVIDVGTGAGLPGIPLALRRPELSFTLLDSNGKKTRFVQQVVAELGIANVTVVHSRVEDFTSPGGGYDTVIARAYASIADLLSSTAHLCRPHAMVLAMKGTYPEGELTVLPRGFSLERVERIQVPGISAERHVALVRKQS